MFVCVCELMAEGGRPAKGLWGQWRLPQHPGAVVPGLAPSEKVQRGHSNFPKSGVGQGLTSLTYQSLEDEEESAGFGLC